MRISTWGLGIWICLGSSAHAHAAPRLWVEGSGGFVVEDGLNDGALATLVALGNGDAEDVADFTIECDAPASSVGQQCTDVLGSGPAAECFVLATAACASPGTESGARALATALVVLHGGDPSELGFADFDLSGTVDGEDFLVVQANLGLEAATFSDGDGDFDGDVDFDDFFLVLRLWGLEWNPDVLEPAPLEGGTAIHFRLREQGIDATIVPILHGLVDTCGSVPLIFDISHDGPCELAVGEPLEVEWDGQSYGCELNDQREEDGRCVQTASCLSSFQLPGSSTGLTAGGLAGTGGPPSACPELIGD